MEGCRKENKLREALQGCCPRQAIAEYCLFRSPSLGQSPFVSSVFFSSERQCERRLTPRSSGAPTAGHQARSGGTRYIFASPGLASCRRRPLSSNVRPRNTKVPAVHALVREFHSCRVRATCALRAGGHRPVVSCWPRRVQRVSAPARLWAFQVGQGLSSAHCRVACTEGSDTAGSSSR